LHQGSFSRFCTGKGVPRYTRQVQEMPPVFAVGTPPPKRSAAGALIYTPKILD